VCACVSAVVGAEANQAFDRQTRTVLEAKYRSNSGNVTIPGTLVVSKPLRNSRSTSASVRLRDLTSGWARASYALATASMDILPPS
jgi:hypothetical protein